MCQQLPRTMKGFNLKRLIKERNLNVEELAKLLYPSVTHPTMSLERVTNGLSELKASQMQALSEYTGLSLTELFGAEHWKAVVKGPDIHEFTNGEYRATLCTTNWKVQIWYLETQIHEEVITSGALPLSEFFKTINRLKEINEISK